MKKHLLSIGIAGILSLGACTDSVEVAEPERFIRYYGSAYDDEGYAVASLPGEGYLLAGNSQAASPEGTRFTRMYAARTDLNGRVLWERTYGGNSAFTNASHVLADDEGGAILYGTVTSHEGDMDVLLLRTDAAGSVMDSITYGIPGQDDIAATILKTQSGFILGNTIGENGKVTDVALREIDAAGSTLWTENYGNIGPLRSISSVVQTASGYAWAGTVARGSDNEIVLVATDSQGAILSQQNILPEGASSIRSAGMQRTGGQYLLAGNVHTGSGKRIAIMNIRLTGNTFAVEQTKIISGNSDQEINWAEPSGNGGLLLGGYYDNGLSLEDWMLIKTDREGNELWRKSYGSGTGPDEIHHITRTPLGDILLLGTVHFANNSIIALYKTDNQGNILDSTPQ
ncbi:hypothetical protein AB9P05_02640 [Roseivirga sp. BDSF3-8]|uniref:hypothetical protein n=1 Tax=Roseivirga sp. BDSF3-8 TaxID=3241598 RepID=UPI00353196E8